MTGFNIVGIIYTLARTFQSNRKEVTNAMDVLWDFFVSVLGGLAANYIGSILPSLFRRLRQGKKGK